MSNRFLALTLFSLFITVLFSPNHLAYGKSDELINLSDMCNKAYGPQKGNPIEKRDFKVLFKESNKDSGFQGVAYQREKDGALFVVFAGTQVKDPKDILADFGIAGTAAQQAERALLANLKGTFNKLFKKDDTTAKEYEEAKKKPLKPGKALQAQLKVAQKFYDRAVKAAGSKNKEKNIFVTGHSLGGYLAQVIACDNNVPGISFNAPGAMGMSREMGKQVVNHTRKNDLVGNFGMHIGDLIDHPDTPFSFQSLTSAYVGRNHSIERFHEYFVDPEKEQKSEVEKEVQTAGKAIESGAKKAGKVIKKGAKTVEKAAKKTGEAVVDFFKKKD